MRADLDTIRELTTLGFCHVGVDESSGLFIANYTHLAQYTPGVWEKHPYLLECRGLIYDAEGTIVARGFRKFFNVSERPETQMEALLSLGQPEIAVKHDGSLGILFYSEKEGRWRVATRGSFASDQALWATRFFHTHYQPPLHHPEYTYLFEIIYPANKIVVDYGEREDLVLIGVVNPADGREYSYDVVRDLGRRHGWSTVEVEEHLDWSLLAEAERPNFEGFVLFWPRRQRRAKLKLADYIRLHRLLSGLNEQAIWELLRTTGDAEELRRQVPEETLEWFDDVVTTLRTHYGLLEADIALHKSVLRIWGLDPSERAQRAKIAEYVAKEVSPAVRGALWRALDGKDTREALWKLCEPKKTGAVRSPAAAARTREDS
jgi:RNA ligase